ncbi:MAG: DUF2283 domain-containing protein [Anaerolineae bacterium]|nr:DUF2283 domain-containing protein [Anaerolineae bacterium]
MAEVKIWYDQEGDYLEVIFEDSPATLEEVGDDIFERRALDGPVVGFAVFNFSRHDRNALTLPLPITILTNSAA